MRTIMVGIKRVVDYNVRVRVKPDGSGMATEGLKMSINPFDEIAIEAALRLREAGAFETVLLVTIGPAAADVHDIAGPQLRGLGIGIYFFTVNIAAYGIGAPLIGKLNDQLGAASAPAMMRYALLLCPLACALGALLLWLGSRRMRALGEKGA